MSVRKRMRYPGHDYCAPCTVHVTICTENRQTLFGTVTSDGLCSNDAGRFVDAAMRGLNAPHLGIAVDTCLVMPDHIHAILILGTDPEVDPGVSVPDLVHRLKMRAFKAWPGGIRRGGWEPYDTQRWQRTYYDTLIESDRHLDLTRAYILDNPRRWWERHHPHDGDTPHHQS